MKKIVLPMLLCVCLIFSACSKSAEETLEEKATAETTIQDETTEAPPETEPKVSQEPEKQSKYPVSFSWNDDAIIMTPQNQDPLGSCAVFAALSMFETHIALTTGELPDLSEMHFISTSDKWSYEFGASPEDVLIFITEQGIITEEKLPYAPYDGPIEPMPNDYGYDYILEYEWGSQLLQGNDLDVRIEMIKQNVLEHGPIISNIGLFNDLGMYTGGIYEGDEDSGVVAGHWLVILGWQDDEDAPKGGYWICKNSWGTEWGEDGFCRVGYGDECGLDDYILYYIDTPQEALKEAVNYIGN